MSFVIFVRIGNSDFILKLMQSIDDTLRCNQMKSITGGGKATV